jgi:hypothetical protein
VDERWERILAAADEVRESRRTIGRKREDR